MIFQFISSSVNFSSDCINRKILNYFTRLCLCLSAESKSERSFNLNMIFWFAILNLLPIIYFIPLTLETADLVTFTQETCNGKLHFLCSRYHYSRILLFVDPSLNSFTFILILNVLMDFLLPSKGLDGSQIQS